MPEFIKIGLLLIMLVSSQLLGLESGSLTLYTLKDGVGLAKSEVLIDSEKSYYTDTDGALHVTLGTGTHQVEIYAKDTAGNNLGYFKKPVIIKSDKDTEVVAIFNSDETQTFKIDTPLESAKSSYQKFDSNHAGTLQGSVLTSDKSLPIANARVFVKGTAIDARTDKEGHFSVTIPADVNVSISVVHSEYSAQTINNIVVKKDATVSQKISLTPASMELEEFIVLAPKVKGSIASIMQEEKESKSISNILGSEEMSKKGDSDAASALKRVTGVTLIGGKDIYVRGLGDRYSNIEMNSMPLPSPNPMKRVVPLDIFPSGVISSLKVQKSATSDIPAAFGGGYVDIRTKEKANEDYIKVMVGVEGNSNTGDDAYTYQGSSTDWMGIDDGYRTLDPKITSAQTIAVGEPLKLIPNDDISKEERAELSKLFVDRNFNVQKEALPIGKKFGFELAKNFDLDNGHKISVFANYKYEQDHNYRDEKYYRYDIDKTTGELKPFANQYGDIHYSKSDFSHSAIFNLGYSYYDVFKIKYTKLFTRNSSKITKISDGILGSNDEDLSYYYLDWEEREMNVDQINGDLKYELFDMDSDFSFGSEWATAKLDQPNNYNYIFYNEEEPRLKLNTSNNISNDLKSDDELWAIYIKNKIEFPMTSDNDYLELGFSTSSKYRESRKNVFALKGRSSEVLTGDIDTIYETAVKTQDEPKLLLESYFQTSNYYDAEVDNTALYFSAFVNPINSIEVLLGVRMVDFKQTVYQYEKDSANPDMSQRNNVVRFDESLSVNKALPSIGLKYKYDSANYVDLAASQTYIAPDIREFSSGVFTHPYEVATIIGNPDLTHTDISSIDLKYSHFFSDSENIKVGLFYKFLKNPIEDAMVPSSSQPIYTYINSDQATLYGIEFDGRKNFDFIDAVISDFYIGGNFSYTDSDVTLTQEQEKIYSTNHRQLQGLSQTVINLSLGYEIKGRSVIASYNKMGERIRKVGLLYDGDRYPDDVEYPAALLDLVWIESYKNGLSFKIKLGNLLDEETLWKQGSNVTKKFKNGRTYKASMSYKF